LDGRRARVGQDRAADRWCRVGADIEREGLDLALHGEVVQ
jgi:hypothetical protein